MKTVRDLPLWPLWVNPEHRVKTALVLMRGHGLPSLGVIKGDTFLGVLHVEDLVGVGEEEPVELVMRRGVETVPPDMPLRQLAEWMADKKVDAVPVLHDEDFLGIVTAQDLLGEVWRNYDPLTGLSWSDSLREWGMLRLQEGREVTILFLDLDDFGQFNKKYGHIVGDRVLQSVAAELQKGIDAATDHLCRYGGDEFAIATIRSRGDAAAFGAWLQERLRLLQVPGSEEPVRTSLGIFGGRRTKERENVHFAATLDNLINLASKQCMEAKKNKGAAPPAHAEPPPPVSAAANGAQVKLLSARSSRSGEQVRLVVVFRTDSKLHTGVAESDTELEAAALAAINAMEESLFPSGSIRLEDADIADAGDGRQAATVVLSYGGESRAASRLVHSSIPEAVAEAVAEAIFG